MLHARCTRAGLLVVAFAFLPLLAAEGSAQPRTTLEPGMTERQVADTLGPPLAVRHAGAWSYLFYANRCTRTCPSDDVVFLCGGRVVTALFRDADRVFGGPGPRTALAGTEGGRCPGAPPPAIARPEPTPPPDGPAPEPVPPAEPDPPPPPADPAPAPPQPPAAAPGPLAAAGDPEHFRALLRLPRVAAHDVIRPGPAGSLSTPTPFGAASRDAFAGVGVQARTRYTRHSDAGAVAGFGIGRREVVALEVAVTSYSTIRTAPGTSGGLSLKAHRTFGRNTGVAAGVENALLWGRSDAIESAYVVGGHVVRFREAPDAAFGAMMVTGGLGNGRFRTERDDAEDNPTINPFGSVSLRVADPIAAIANWTGQDLNLGVSVRPVRRVGLIVTAGLADVTGTAGDGARFIASAGYGFLLENPFNAARR